MPSRQEKTVPEQGTMPIRRNQVYQQHRGQRQKERSILTGFATPFHIDNRRRTQDNMSPIRLPGRTSKGKTKVRQRLTNIDMVGNKSVIVHLLIITNPKG